MRSFKPFIALFSLAVSASTFGQLSDNNDWLQQSLQKQKAVTERLKGQGILEQYAPGAVQQNIEKYQNQAKEIATSTSQQLPKHLQKDLGLTQKAAHSFVGNVSSPSDSLPSLSAIFVSFSMPTSLLLQAFEEAYEQGAEVYIKGFHPDDRSVADTMKRLYAMIDAKQGLPKARFHPKAFKEFNVTTVPVVLHAEKGNVAYVSGTLNLGWLKEQMQYTQGLSYLGKQGPTRRVIEKDIIEEIKSRMALVDMEERKKKAVANFWKKRQFVSLPNAEEASTHYIDPSIKVQKDVVNPNGAVLARAGEVLNPIKRVASNNTYILINAMYPDQVKWAKERVEQEGYLSTVMVMTSQLDTQRGWDHLSELRKSFKREIYMLPQRLVDVLSLTGLPALVTTDMQHNMLKVEQIPLGEDS